MNISIEQWDAMTAEDQDNYITDNAITIGYSSSIADTLTAGFGNLDDMGFWEYQLKSVWEDLS